MTSLSLPSGMAAKLIDALSAPSSDWRATARPEQLPPSGAWRTWLILAGRGWGKTRTGAETVLAWVASGQCRRLALVGATAADVRDVMVEGESGIMACAERAGLNVQYEPTKRRLAFPGGATATTFSADEPDRLRGPQYDGGWADELAAWRYPDAWDQLMLGLRLGNDPRVVVTTTPKPVKLIRDLVADVESGRVWLTRGRTFDNRANLAPAFIETIVAKYQGTRLGRQEIEAEVLEDVPGALWSRSAIDDLRVSAAPSLVRVVVSIDPAVTTTTGSDETGIVVAGKGSDGHGYILADYSDRYSPNGWASRAVQAYHAHEADRIVAERNQGGDMVENTLRAIDADVPITLVVASRGKATRAEPVAALYEQGKVHHVGSLPELEDQQCAFTPDGSSGMGDDRVDALVWALTELQLGVANKMAGWMEWIREDHERQGWRGPAEEPAPEVLVI